MESFRVDFFVRECDSIKMKFHSVVHRVNAELENIIFRFKIAEKEGIGKYFLLYVSILIIYA